MTARTLVPTQASAALYCRQPTHRIGLHDRTSRRMVGMFTFSLELPGATRADASTLGQPTVRITPVRR